MDASITPVTYALTTAQTEIWLAQQLHPGSPIYNIAQYTVIEGVIEPAVFEAALRQVIDEADTLRLQFVDSDDGLRQRIGAPAWSMPVLDFTAQADPQAAAQAWMQADYQQPVNLMQGPLFCYALLKVAPAQWIWYQRYHHIMTDGYGQYLIAQRVAHVYSALCTGTAPAACDFGSIRQLLERDAQYQASAQRAQDEAYWLKHCAHWPEPATLASRAAPAFQQRLRQTTYLAPQWMEDYVLDAGRLAQFLSAALAAYLHRMTGAQDVLFGFPVTARLGEDWHIPGMVANTVPLRFRFEPEINLLSLMRQAAKEIQSALQYQRYPSEALQRQLGLASGQSLLGIKVNVMPFDYGLSFGGHSSTNHNLLAGPVEDLMLGVYWTPNSRQLRIDFDANPACYTAEMLDAHQRRFIRFVQALAADATQPISEIDLLAADERHRLLVEWNATQRDYPAHLCIHQLFEAQVERTPEAPALVFEAQTLSYAQLNARANRLAHQLLEWGVKPDARVAICVQRSPALVVGLLAILKAGGAYVPLDPAYPGERLAHILADAAPNIVLADAAGRAALSDVALAECTVLDPTILPALPDTNPSVAGLTARHLAYVIYTSGSTGTPKGVMVEHRGVVNLALAQIACFGVQPASRIVQFASFSFDASASEILMAFGSGAALYLPPETARHDRHALWDYLASHAITHATLPPALLQHGADLASFGWSLTLILAGEAPSATLIRDLAEQGTVFNAYGPTETTVCATAWHGARDFSGEVPIGRPIANTRVYLLDAHGQPVPLGAVGELYIGGAGVARGYLNRPELTAERFVPDPFSEDANARLYKTGDVARYLPDGNLEFLGRNDEQVKVRGFRIEPGEIAACLMAHPQVRDAVVLATGEGSAKRLVAYVQAEADEHLASTLRAQVAASLPEYMVPSAFVRLDAFPLTPNGKLDRRALPAPDDDALAHQAYEAPQGELETTLATIWAELLGVKQVGRHDSFFALGGHSLLAVRLMNRVRMLGADVPLATLFATPTLAAFAAALDAHWQQGPDALPEITPVSREGRLPLSFAQQRLWFLAQLDGASESYHIPLALRVRGPLDRAAWQQALDALFARHEALRLTFVSVDGQPQVQLLPADRGVPLRWHDLRGVSDADAQLSRLTADEACAPFDLARGPLMRACVIQLADDEHVLVLTKHHIVSDGWSIGVLVRELNALYTAACTGQPDPLPPLAVQYPDYAAWQRQWLTGERLQAQSDYWRATLADAPVLLALPTDRPRPVQQSFAGAHVPVQIDASTTQALKRLSAEHGTTLFMTVLAAWSAVLARLSGQDDVVIGTPSANRGHAAIEPLIGFFVNTLALRVNLEGELTTTQLLERVRRTTLDAQAHQDLPFEQVVEIVQPPRRLDHTPLFQVIFAWQSNETGQWRLPGLDVKPGELDYDMVRFDLEMHLYEAGDQIIGSLHYASALFDRATIERYVGYLTTMLQAMVACPQQPVATLQMLEADERQLLLQTWNATAAPYPAHQCLHQLFEAQVQHSPDATALVYEEQTLSYAQLNARANRLAHRLIELGVKPDARVAICVERSPAMVVGLLAILKAGGACVPLDPAYPCERLAHILHDAAPPIVLADATGRATLGEATLACRTVLEPDVALDQAALNPQVAELTPRHLAYVIYTSGSTGTPKGVMIEHVQIARLFEVTKLNGTLNEDQALFDRPRGYSLTSADRVLQKTSFNFDISIWELFGTLLNGAALVVADADVHKDPVALMNLIVQERITTVHFVPSMLSIFLDTEGAQRCTSVKHLICSGEALPGATVQRCQTLLPDAQVHNLYGPTENLIGTTFWTCPVACVEDNIPIGRPIANTRVYLLDAHGQPVPLGAVGELYIGGAGVARGYLNRPELTAERFVPDPFSIEPDARLYKTGDLARYLPDGNLEFLGRNDEQVKLRGFRIEPGEIEACLTAHPQVRDAVVLATGEGSAKRLVAYVQAEANEHLASTLRAQVAASLPEYMVPSAFVRLDAWPLTPNGKLDRRALPAPDDDALAHQAYEAPQGELETTLAAIWAELLGVERVGRHDSFFALGGHSLLAVRLINRVRGLGADVPLATLFATPTLAAFAAALDAPLQQGADALPEITPVSREGSLPLSFAQQRLWFLAQLDGVSDTYHIPLALRVRGPLDRAAWQQALDALFARHEALRLTFVSVDGQPQVQLLPADRGVPLRWHDLRGVSDADAQLSRLTADEACAPFDLARGPLIHACGIQVADDEHVMLLTQHHIVSDGWSIGVLARELSALYAASVGEQADPLPPLAVQYPDYAAWQRRWLTGERLQAQSDYWRTTLADAPALLELPTDRPRPAQQSFAGAHVPVRMDVATTQALKRLSAEHGTTLFMTVLAAWSVELARLSGQHDVVIGTPSANRGHAAIEPLIGFFVNTLALRVDLSDEPNTSELLKRVRRTTLDAQAHQDLPFEQVVEIVQPPRRLNHTPLFQMMLAWQNNEPGEWRLPGLTATPAELEYDVVKFDLELNLFEAGDEVVGSLAYATALFDRSTIERHVEYLQTMLCAMVACPQQPVATLELLSPAERQLLLQTWNATQQAYPSHVCVHQLFEAQVKRTPEAPALVFEDQTFSYAQLNAQANRLAHQLIELGVKPDARVAICVQRSPALVVGLLAILKAGGAYVPLDPSYPSERLVHILADAAPSIVLADAAGRAALGDAALAECTVLDPAELPALPDTNLSVAALTARHLAYVIYTSGSTGTPKGVMVPHHAIARLVINNGYVDIGTGDRVAFAANPAFDASTFEVWAPLLNGATIVVIDHDTVLMPAAFAHTLREQRISILWLTVGLFNQMAAQVDTAFSQLKALIVGGDVLDARLVAQVMRESPPEQLLNGYGPTESTTFATTYKITSVPERNASIPIGRPIANTRVYLLDAHGQPVPLGAVGELYIGGAGVARGYLNRPELTAERFVRDPFVDESDARMYKTGDLARYLPDGNLEFLGRNDDQIKIRGFRIEPGEIEACLTAHPQVRDAVVLATGEGSAKRLVAYVQAEADEHLASTLRAQVAASLPEYMVPSAFMRLDAWPLTPNGKLDRRALPAPDDEAFAHQAYEAPQGELETTLAAIWAELLGVKQVGRYDSFFALGGHSLLAVQLIERLRRRGLSVSVRLLFEAPTLSALAQTLGQRRDVAVPANAITPDTTAITPSMLPLIELTQADIDKIVEQVPQGVANIQDIYALSPLQDGLLFHHLLASTGDPYLLMLQLAFETRERLDQYLHALQQVIDRHDILRTALVWEGVSMPAQVVWRHARLPVTELTLDAADGPIAEQLARRFDPRHTRLDLTQAPLLHCAIAQDNEGRWLLTQRLHHLIGDHSTLEVMHAEVHAFIGGRGDSLPPAQPFRHLVAQARLGVSQAEHERFFTEQLADIEEPTLPFGLAQVQHDGSDVSESHRMLPPALNDRLRAHAKRLGVSLASLCHLAWAQVLARASGQPRVVFGTVLFGRMQAGSGADRAMGLFINTLPLRVDLDGSVQACVRSTHARLAALLEHEHASLALAQRCSGVPAGTPLFSALLNYRHNAMDSSERGGLPGVELLSAQERTNYPIGLSVDDDGQSLGLTAQSAPSLEPERVCAYMQQALHSLADALEAAPDTAVQKLQVLPEAERELLLDTWNATQQVYPSHVCVHQLFEAQVERTPEAPALVFEDQTFSYAALNAQANRLAHQLIEWGVKPDARVAICVQRSPALVVGLLAILKAGGAYVPLDPAYPSERLVHILADAAPNIVLADAAGRAALGDAALAECTVLDPTILPALPDTNPSVANLTARHLAYVIYTSGSTGTPKGVMVEHRGVVNLALAQIACFGVQPTSRILQFVSFSFDVSASDIFTTLGCGASLYLSPETARHDRNGLWNYLIRHQITHVALPPALLQNGEGLPHLHTPLTLIVGGETPSATLVRDLAEQGTVFNAYGPTETTVCATAWLGARDFSGEISIGRPIANIRVYLLDAHGQPVPLGAVGELYIGGAGVARGYLNRPELTAERFVPDPFSIEPDERLYKTGDVARYLPDGNLELLGRNDEQVKIRGFRIEPGEIEACLTAHPQVRDAVVLATGEGSAKRLVAYVQAEADEHLASTLRAQVAASLPEYMVPSAFVRLDAFPLTPNGKLDRRALPAPDDAALAHQAYEAPQGELETTLAAIWAELLGVERVGRHDSFFALGGHSLLAMRLINRVRTALGVDLAIRTLFEAPTLAGLARHLVKHDGIQENSFSVLLPLKPTGSRPALFCIHPALGLSWSYMGLSNYLHPDQPLYGLQARGFDGTGPLASTVDEMVSDYLEQMRRVQPKGPYCLLGWSLGGNVAHSMAVRLEHQGEKVALLALLDSTPFAGKAFGEQEDQFDQAMVKDVFADYYGNELVAAMDEHLLENTEEIAKNNGCIVRDYSLPQYGGDALLFRATVAEAGFETLVTPDAWNPYVRGNIEVCNVHCSHGEMLKPESTALIGPILARKLNELEKQQTQGQTNAVR